MDLFKSLIIILLSSVLINNYVLSRFLGICPFLGVSKKLDQATGMGISVTAVMLLAPAASARSSPPPGARMPARTTPAKRRRARIASALTSAKATARMRTAKRPAAKIASVMQRASPSNWQIA